MTGTKEAPRICPQLDFLRARKWQDDHGFLLERMKSQETTLDSVSERAVKASEVSSAAARDVRQLRDDFESFVDDPQEKQMNEHVSNVLTGHEKDISTLKLSVNNWRLSFQACQEDITQVEMQLEGRMKEAEEELQKVKNAPPPIVDPDVIRKLSDRLTALEAQNNQLNGVAAQVNTMQCTLDSLKTTCTSQAAEIAHLKQALAVEAKKQPKAVQKGKAGTKQTRPSQAHTKKQSHVQVPQSPTLTASNFDPSTLHPTSDCLPAVDSSVGRNYHSSTMHPTSGYRTAQEAPIAGQYEQEAQGNWSDDQPFSDTQATTQLDEENDLNSELTVGIDDLNKLAMPRKTTYKQSSPRKKPKLSLDIQGNQTRQIVQSNEVTRSVDPDVERLRQMVQSDTLHSEFQTQEAQLRPVDYDVNSHNSEPAAGKPSDSLTIQRVGPAKIRANVSEQTTPAKKPTAQLHPAKKATSRSNPSKKVPVLSSGAKKTPTQSKRVCAKLDQNASNGLVQTQRVTRGARGRKTTFKELDNWSGQPRSRVPPPSELQKQIPRTAWTLKSSDTTPKVEASTTTPGKETLLPPLQQQISVSKETEPIPCTAPGPATAAASTGNKWGRRVRRKPPVIDDDGDNIET